MIILSCHETEFENNNNKNDNKASETMPNQSNEIY